MLDYNKLKAGMILRGHTPPLYLLLFKKQNSFETYGYNSDGIIIDTVDKYEWSDFFEHTYSPNDIIVIKNKIYHYFIKKLFEKRIEKNNDR